MTLEAFADTIVPGEKRSVDDRAVAGAAAGGGAVASGAVELLETPAVGLATALGDIVDALNGHALEHAAEHGLALDGSVPPFVALPFAHRTALVQTLTGPAHQQRDIWVALALFSNMAFDTAAHLHTAEAIEAGHPGLATLGFAKPDADGVWRFPDYSYRRQLANVHPNTTASGSPA
ncbi:MAG: regulator [Actinobacteria bacterium]|nr:regulator [Actinomycetota bacterium]MBI3686956.1 regulator [Actinomycetota bacterium]